MRRYGLKIHTLKPAPESFPYGEQLEVAEQYHRLNR